MANGLHGYTAKFIRFIEAALPDAGTETEGMTVRDSADSKLKTWKDGEWTELGGGGGGGAGGLIWYTSTDQPGPATEYLTNLEFDVYPASGFVYKWAILNVPDSYVAGNQITLKKGVCVVNSTDTGKDIHFKVQSYLLRVGQSFSTLADTDVSTNPEIAVGGTANIGLAVGDIDITNEDGEIDSIAVSPGDRILMQFYRSTDTETVSVPEDVLFLKDSLIPDFGG